MTFKLDAKTRTATGKKAALLREKNKIPAVLYGHGVKNENLELDYISFEKLYQEAGESTLVDLVIDGKEPVKTLISDLQYDPIKDKIAHVDFLQIRMDEKIHAHVKIEFGGESKVVKEDGGILVYNIDEVEIKCFPKDLIHEIKVDVSRLQNFDDAIAISDLSIPPEVEILHHEPEDVVVLVTEPKEEKIEEPVPVAAEGAAGEQPAKGAEAAGKGENNTKGEEKK